MADAFKPGDPVRHKPSGIRGTVAPQWTPELSAQRFICTHMGDYFWAPLSELEPAPAAQPAPSGDVVETLRRAERALTHLGACDADNGCMASPDDPKRHMPVCPHDLEHIRRVLAAHSHRDPAPDGDADRKEAVIAAAMSWNAAMARGENVVIEALQLAQACDRLAAHRDLAPDGQAREVR